jgi:hypothetical protein
MCCDRFVSEWPEGRVAGKTEITRLKRRHGRRLLQLPGVVGVGVERGDGDDDYVLVIHVEEDDPSTREAVKQTVSAEPVRIVESGRFKKQ